jgi:hypothetical protein
MSTEPLIYKINKWNLKKSKQVFENLTLTNSHLVVIVLIFMFMLFIFLTPVLIRHL